MPKPFRLASCGLVAAAVAASGCGSSKTATTPKAASATATAPAPNQATSAQQAPHTSKAHTRKPAATTPSGQTTAPPTRRAPLLKAKPEPKAPPKGGQYEYPVDAKREFIAICLAHGSSKSGCECIIERYARRRVEEGRSLAELLGVEIALKDALPLPPRTVRYLRACKSSLH